MGHDIHPLRRRGPGPLFLDGTGHFPASPRWSDPLSLDGRGMEPGPVSRYGGEGAGEQRLRRTHADGSEVTHHPQQEGRKPLKYAGATTRVEPSRGRVAQLVRAPR